MARSLLDRRLYARGLPARTARAWRSRRFAGIGNRATLTLNPAGANNDLFFYSKVPGTGGNAITVRIVVAGANTALSTSVAGSAITVNSATNGASAATSTARDVIRALHRDPAVTPLIWAQNAPQSDGSGVVAAVGATALAGAV